VINKNCFGVVWLTACQFLTATMSDLTKPPSEEILNEKVSSCEVCYITITESILL